jgi:hypothetical protein
MIPKSDNKVPPAFMSKKKQQFVTRGMLLKVVKIQEICGLIDVES